MEPPVGRYTSEEREILAVFPELIPFNSPEPIPINEKEWKDTGMEAPIYFAGFYLHDVWVHDVFDARNEAKVRGGYFDKDLVNNDNETDDPPLTSYSIIQSGDEGENYFVLIEWNGPGLNEGWIKNWENYIDFITTDMKLTDAEAKMAKDYCGWHLITPDPYFPGCIPLEKMVH